MTLNQLKTTLKTFAINHGILKGSFYFEFPEQREPSGGLGVSYPCLFSAVEQSVLNDGSETITVKLYVMDKPKTGDDLMRDKMMSDAGQIMNDIIVYLSKYYVVNKPVTKQPFYQFNDDLACGWESTVEIKTKFNWSVCLLPVTGTPSPELMNSYIINQSGNVIYILPPNSFYTVSEFQTIIDTIVNNQNNIIDQI